MEELGYDGLTEKWKADLIISRARRMGFRPDELPDIQQRLIGQVSAFQFCKEKSNGGTERTALRSLIDNQLKKIRRADTRYRKLVKSLEGEPVPEPDFESEELIIDVRGAIAALQGRDRKVCAWLIEDLSQHEMARRLNCGWYTVDRIIRRIHSYFESLGLKDYVIKK